MDGETMPSKGAELIENARGLVPALRQRAEESSRVRNVPAETIEDFWSAGLFGALKPKAYGGSEIRYDDYLKIGMELARGDGSAAWVYSVVTVHELLIALYPKEVQDEIWSNPRSLSASSFAPSGKAEPADGGYRLSGKWSFCSGVNHSDWILLSAIYGMQGNPPEPDIRYAMVPLAECTVLDDWHVMGLCGTGSNTVIADGVFVPNPYIVSVTDFRLGKAPGGRVHAGNIYRTPMFATFPFCLSAPAPGIARGALEQFVEATKTRESHIARTPLREMRHVQMRVAEASALIDAAELLFIRAATETTDKIEAGEPLSIEHRVRSRRDMSYAVVMATQAAELLFKSTGGQGLFESQPVQRAYRDLHALGAHVATNWDLPSASYGSVILGGAPTDTLL